MGTYPTASMLPINGETRPQAASSTRWFSDSSSAIHPARCERIGQSLNNAPGEMAQGRSRRFAWRAHAAFSRLFLTAFKRHEGGTRFFRQTLGDSVQQLDELAALQRAQG